MAVVDIVEFELGKVQAAAHWRDKGEHDVADAFLRIELDVCNIGLDRHGRLAWARVGWLVVGLRFDLETGDYTTSFYHRLRRPDPSWPGPPQPPSPPGGDGQPGDDSPRPRP